MHRFRFLLDVHNVYAHILFWLLYYLYRVYLYIDIYEHTLIVQFIELFVKVTVVYINMYVLMPLLLKRNKEFWYIITIVSLLVLGTEIQLLIIRWCIHIGIYTDIKISVLYSKGKVARTASHIFNILVFTSIIKILKDNYIHQQKTQQLQQEKLEAELKFLRSQINPHFFFNTLNNLYSLILSKSEQAQEVTLKLSDLMSYILYDSNQEQVLLSQEIACLQNYIALESLRFGDELEVSFAISGDEDAHTIPPILLLPFVENSFKHCNPDGKSPIHIKIELKIDTDGLEFIVENSIGQTVAVAIQDAEVLPGGIGMTNVQRRLNLLFQEDYTLHVEQTTEMYKIYLNLPLDYETT